MSLIYGFPYAFSGANGFDILASEITVQNSGGTIVTLTGVDGTTAGVTVGYVLLLFPNNYTYIKVWFRQGRLTLLASRVIQESPPQFENRIMTGV